MAFPKQKDIEVPLLRELAARGGQAAVRDIIDGLVKRFPGLTSADLQQKTAWAIKTRAKETKWANMCWWVRQKLKAKGELDSPAKSIWRITQKGRVRLEAGGVEELLEYQRRLVGGQKRAVVAAPSPTFISAILSRHESMNDLSLMPGDLRPEAILAQAQTLEERAKLAHAAMQQLGRRIQSDFIDLAYFALVVRKEALWKHLGLDSWDTFVNNLEIGVSPKQMSLLANMWEWLIERRGVSQEALARIGSSRAAYLLPVARQGPIDPELLQAAQTVPARELLALLGHKISGHAPDKPAPQLVSSTSPDTHTELIAKIKDMGKKLGMSVDKTEPQAPYQHDNLWRPNPFISPKVAWEVCVGGNIDKDITSLTWAANNWQEMAVLVTADDKDYEKARRVLGQAENVHIMKAVDLVKLYGLVEAGYAPVLRRLFGL